MTSQVGFIKRIASKLSFTHIHYIYSDMTNLDSRQKNNKTN